MEDLEIASRIKHEQDFHKQYGSYANMLQQRNEEKSSMTRSLKKRYWD